jgi:hypothetical protein
MKYYLIYPFQFCLILESQFPLMLTLNPFQLANVVNNERQMSQLFGAIIVIKVTFKLNVLRSSLACEIQRK